jgi:chaperone modulatory protein CbpM
MATKETVIAGLILDEHSSFTLHEVCSLCGVRSELILELVGEGIVEPQGRGALDWRFNGLLVKRVQTAVRLQRDLDINLPGVALALELLDRIDQLESSFPRDDFD